MRFNNYSFTFTSPTNGFASTIISSTESIQSDIEIITFSVLHVFDLLVNCVFINVIGFLGIVGNVFNLVILTRHGATNSTNLLLISLSACDLAYVLAIGLRRSRCVISLFDAAAGLTMEAVQSAFFLSLNTLFSKISSGHILLISFERLFAVYSPLKVSQYFTQSKTICYLSSIFVFWIALILPICIPLFQFRWIFNTKLNATVGDVIYSDFTYKNWEALGILTSICNWIQGPLQFGIISIASTCTILKLHEYNLRRSTMTSSSPVVDVRVAKMLLTVCLTYLLTSCLTFIPTIFYLVRADLMSDSGSESRFGQLLEMLTDLLGVISASVNFIIYVRMSKKFRSTYAQLNCRCSPGLLSHLFQKIKFT